MQYIASSLIDTIFVSLLFGMMSWLCLSSHLLTAFRLFTTLHFLADNIAIKTFRTELALHSTWALLPYIQTSILAIAVTVTVSTYYNRKECTVGSSFKGCLRQQKLFVPISVGKNGITACSITCVLCVLINIFAVLIKLVYFSSNIYSRDKILYNSICLNTES